MVTFIVPVKSKKVTGDWPHFIKLVNRTLKSVCNQTNKHYEVIVVCHELPEIEFKNDKLHYIQVDFEPPVLKKRDYNEDNAAKELDKIKKIKEGLAYASRFNPEYTMIVDSDDCISSEIVDYVLKDKTQTGWYVNKGYYYKEGSQFIFYKRKTFNFMCGTCVIVKPELIDEFFEKQPWLHFAHEKIKLSNNRTLAPLPFAGAVYSIANGENHFMTISNTGNMFKKYFLSKKRIFLGIKKVLKYRFTYLSKSIRNTYGIYTIIRTANSHENDIASHTVSKEGHT